jgi:hypothetical protein
MGQSSLKRLFVHLPINYESSACCLYRSVLPLRHVAPFLRRNGWGIEVEGEIDARERYDAIYFSRMPSPVMVCHALAARRRHGTRIIYEIDDDVATIPKFSPISLSEAQKDLCATAAEVADTVICSTGQLALKWPTKSIVAPNLVETGMVGDGTPPDDSTPVRVAWAGSTTHSGDLEVIKEPLRRLMWEFGDRCEWVFKGMTLPDLVIEFFPTVLRVEKFTDIPGYFSWLREYRPHVAFCPLADEEFNLSKSDLKVSEFAACGAAVCASDYGPYKAAPCTASTPDEWYATLKLLIESVEYRRSVVEKQRAYLADHTWNAATIRRWERVFATALGIAD